MSSHTQRVLRVLKALRGHSIEGLSNTELSQLLDESPVNITRAVQELMDEGLVSKLVNGKFVHSLEVELMGVTHLLLLQDVKARIKHLKTLPTAEKHHE